ncbi:MAG TPA: hypothetical protein V6C57_04675 [Coleofasciculaceae cyanobacterium]
MYISKLPIAPILGFFVLLTACSSPSSYQEKASSPSTLPGSPSTLPAPSVITAPAQIHGTPVTVKLSEFKIDMPTALSAGATTFSVSNAGRIDHNFAIEGNGIEQKFDINLKPGETKTLTVNLKPGQYRVYCPVDSHVQSGMENTLTVS